MLHVQMYFKGGFESASKNASNNLNKPIYISLASKIKNQNIKVSLHN